MDIQLRPYQDEFYNNIRNSFSKGNKSVVGVLPCAAGKTVILAKMAKMAQAKGKVIYFILHRKELLEQTYATFEKFDIPLDLIHIFMVKTLANKITKGTLDVPDADFLLLDECHLSLAKTWTTIIDNFPKAHILGVTATPLRLDGKPLKQVYQDMVVGVEATELTSMGYLADFDYYAPLIADLSSLKKKGKDFDMKDAEEKLSGVKIYGDVIKYYRELAAGRQTIVYAPSVKYSKQIADEFNQAGIKASHFDGTTKKKDRTDIMNAFRNGDIQVLTNCELIMEGVDIPSASCCILLRPTMSTAIFIQQSGRALRPQPGKKAIILDHVGNYTRHGLPTDHRDWSLDSALKPIAEYNTEGEFAIRQCLKCYKIFRTAAVCPWCGYEYEVTGREIEQIKEVRLIKVKAANKARDEKNKEKYREHSRNKVREYESANQCKTLQEFIEFGRMKKYNGRWGYMAFKRMKK